jgi:hypothetical protein
VRRVPTEVFFLVGLKGPNHALQRTLALLAPGR